MHMRAGQQQQSMVFQNDFVYIELDDLAISWFNLICPSRNFEAK
jgi:hypothetical protein